MRIFVQINQTGLVFSGIVPAAFSRFANCLRDLRTALAAPYSSLCNQSLPHGSLNAFDGSKRLLFIGVVRSENRPRLLDDSITFVQRVSICVACTKFEIDLDSTCDRHVNLSFGSTSRACTTDGLQCSRESLPERTLLLPPSYHEQATHESCWKTHRSAFLWQNLAVRRTAIP